jgi:hypothetical protein
MTIWMSLDFSIDGQPAPALRRAFYDSIFETAPGNTYFGPQGDEKTITVSGCVREGVECLTFVPFSGHEKYSLVSGSKLEIGSAYQITASIVDVSICQAGKALKPIEVKKLDRKCS